MNNQSDSTRTKSRTFDAPSRRTVVRAAAWTAPAVIIATTASAAAAVSVINPTVTYGEPTKYSVTNDKYVQWDITISAGSLALNSVVVTLTYDQTGGGGKGTLDALEGRTVGAGGTWTPTITKALDPSDARLTYSTTIAPNGTVVVHVLYKGSDNSAGLVSATVTAVQGTQTVSSIVGTPSGPVSWGSDSVHAGH